MSEPVLNKVLEKTLQKVKTMPGAEKEVEKINKLLSSGSKESKKEYVRSRIHKSHKEDSLNRQLKSSVKPIDEKDEILKENSLAGKIGKGIVGTVIALGAGAGMFFLGSALGPITGAALSGIPVAVVITLFSSAIVAGIGLMIADKYYEEY